METIRNGSKGEAVKLLQKLLGIKVDGVFGSDTTVAVCKFQRAKGLSIDGIVGASTWRALGVQGREANASRTVVTVKKPLSFCLSPLPNRAIKYIVVHYTAGSHSRQGKAVQNYEIWRSSGKASADFAVDDVDIVQFNPDPRNKYSWAVGGKSYGNKGGRLFGVVSNRNSISVEICSTCVPSTSKAVTTDNHRGWSFSAATLENARKIVRELMREYGIDKAHVVRHYDVTGKLCPGVVGWNDEPIKDINGNKTGETSNSASWEAWKASL